LTGKEDEDMGTGLKVSTFQQRFATLFDESEKTITELAKELHVSNQTISAWKTGTRSPKEPTIIAIANYFGVRVDWLMGFDVEKKPSTREIIEQGFREYGYETEMKPKNDDIRLLIRGLNKMSPEQIQQAKSMMKIMFAKYFNEENDDAT
jgi:transcriptional regulator with XRE-family HTH domain